MLHSFRPYHDNPVPISVDSARPTYCGSLVCSSRKPRGIDDASLCSPSDEVWLVAHMGDRPAIGAIVPTHLVSLETGEIRPVDSGLYFRLVEKPLEIRLWGIW